jgi:hypothetical protein
MIPLRRVKLGARIGRPGPRPAGRSGQRAEPAVEELHRLAENSPSGSEVPNSHDVSSPPAVRDGKPARPSVAESHRRARTRPGTRPTGRARPVPHGQRSQAGGQPRPRSVRRSGPRQGPLRRCPAGPLGAPRPGHGGHEATGWAQLESHGHGPLANRDVP